MKKLISKISILIAVIFLLTACGGKPTTQDSKEKPQEQPKVNEKYTVNIIVPNGTPAMSLVKMLKEKPAINEQAKMDYQLIVSTDVLSSKLLSKEADIAIIPTNLAAKLYNKGNKYILCGVGIWGNLYLVSSEEMSTVDQLKGKEIYVNGKGLTPDILLQYLLKNIGLNPQQDVELSYVSGASELAPMFISGKSTLSIMPEPMLSVVKKKKPDTKVILDLQEEWKNAFNQELSYPQAAVVVKEDFYKENKEFVKQFLEEYKKGIEWINDNPKEAGVYSEEIDLGFEKDIVEKSLPGSNLTFVSAKDAKDAVEKYLTVLNDFSPETIGGKLPDEGFYFEE